MGCILLVLFPFHREKSTDIISLGQMIFFLLLSTFICWTCFLAVAALATVTTSYCHRATIQSLKSFKRRKTAAAAAALTTWQWYIR